MKVLEEMRGIGYVLDLLKKVPVDAEVPACKILKKGRAEIRISLAPKGVYFDVKIKGGSDEDALKYYAAARSELLLEGAKFLKTVQRELEKLIRGEEDASSA